MLTRLYSAAIEGIDARPVGIETVVERGATFTMVGMADTAVRESYQRLIAATRQSGFEWPHKRIVINLNPADMRKAGAGYDLPMALGVLTADGQLPLDSLEGVMAVGELSLSGSVLPVRGILPIAIQARRMGIRRLLVPADNVTEAAIVDNVDIYGVETLRQATGLLRGESDLRPTKVDTCAIFAQSQTEFPYDFSEVKGQEAVKRAFEVACAGGHNILLIGSPGSGKSMMAKRLPSIMPPLTMEEALETTKIHSVAGCMAGGTTRLTQRPFRSPHHTLSPVAMVGGGTTPHPGEISLAHNGVLFLDEFPEFSRTVLEVLRQPMEDRVISISRSAYAVNYPASFMLVASMNPCPCGYYGHPTRQCICTPQQVLKYMGRVSGPLLDRIDLHVEAQPVEIDSLTSRRQGESSAAIRARVVAARQRQTERFAGIKGVHCNAQMNTALLHRFAWPDAAGIALLKNKMQRLNMSARAFDRILRVARTIADLDNSPGILTHHLNEAIGYRALDRDTWGKTF